MNSYHATRPARLSGQASHHAHGTAVDMTGDPQLARILGIPKRRMDADTKADNYLRQTGRKALTKRQARRWRKTVHRTMTAENRHIHATLTQQT